MARLRPLREAGVQIALDDFGMGYAGLHQLQQMKALPVDILKIDKVFIDMLPEDVSMVPAMIQLARGLSLRIVAEGVENDAQRRWLQAAGVEVLQAICSVALCRRRHSARYLPGPGGCKFVNVLLTCASQLKDFNNCVALSALVISEMFPGVIFKPQTSNIPSCSVVIPKGHPMKTSIFKSLYVRVLTAIAIGILLGHFYPELGAQMKPFGDAFVKLIKMVIAPVIFCTVVTGIAGMESMKAVGRTGAVALLYFEVVSTIALIIGLIIVNVVQPGAGMNVDPSTLDAKAVAVYAEQAKDQGVVAFLLDVIPGSVIGAFASGNILQVLLFAVLFGFALHRLGSKGQLIFNVIESFSRVIFGIINMIMRTAPIGAFGAMAFTIGKYGVGTWCSWGS